MDQRTTNKEILDILNRIVDKFPQVRFGQILFNYVLKYSQSDSGQIHIDDPYYDSNETTLKRIKERVKKYDITGSIT